jgi:hypothetical protein
LEDHWFDTLNKVLVQKNPRRSLLGTAGLLASLGDPLSAAAKKEKKRNNRKKKDKHKKKEKVKDQDPPRLCGLDVHDACASTFSLGQHIQDCTDLCEHCRAAGTAFCISERDESPTCCLPGERCCGVGSFGSCCPTNKCCTRADGAPPFCAPASEVCCRDGTGGSCPRGEACCTNGTCLACDPLTVPNPVTCQCECPGGGAPPCGCADNCVGPSLACCDGECVNITVDEIHCGGCNQPCVPGLECCAGRCIDPLSDQEFCGGCFAPPCTGGWLCCDGDCKDLAHDEEHCGGCGQTCIGPDLECCDGNCVNTRTDPLNCGGCGRGGLGLGCCGGNPYRPSEQFCCPDELRPCNNNQVCCPNNLGNPDCCPRP